ncbi:MAG: diguanylate cyclase [Myxococcales bacterium]
MTGSRWTPVINTGALRRGAWASALALSVTLALAVLDYTGGRELNLEPLYLLPVSVAAWYAGVIPAALIAAVSAVSSQLANEAAGLVYLQPELRLTNMAMQLLVGTTVGLLIGHSKHRFALVEWSSRHDALTGLHNARAFYERADEELERARRYRKPLTAAYIDLDNFKTLNDRHGHHAGDTALRTVANLLRRTARASDVTARLGGDEFAILMPETDAEGARAVLERLRSELERSLADCSELVSASIGAVSFVELPDSVEQLMSAADHRMYAVKRAGKNLVRVDQFEREGSSPTRSA